MTEGARVDVRDVFHIYREVDIETVALRGVDLRVESGEYVALIGRSGSGKSTLLNLLAAADRPAAGEVRVDGVDLAQAPEAQRVAMRGRVIQFLAQSGNLVEFLDLRETVRLAGELAGAPVSAGDADEALARVGLGGAARRRPRQLSGGEQQRAALAMALATRPRLLLADELTGELDRATASAVLDTLDELRRTTGLTVIAATHDRATAARSDRVVELRDGRMRSVDGAGSGTTAERDAAVSG
jgi:putative ABC transport system ATP-binding protein